MAIDSVGVIQRFPDTPIYERIGVPATSEPRFLESTEEVNASLSADSVLDTESETEQAELENELMAEELERRFRLEEDLARFIETESIEAAFSAAARAYTTDVAVVGGVPVVDVAA